MFNTDKKNDQTTLNWLWQAENIHQKPLLFTFKIELVFDQKKLEMKLKKKKFSSIWKNLCQTASSIETFSMNLFRKVLLSNAQKITPFEKNSKNTFLVNSKKWKKWGKGSSKWNHPKVALKNCHYFVNLDPHAKICENPTGSFCEQISFSGISVVLISLLYL